MSYQQYRKQLLMLFLFASIHWAGYTQQDSGRYYQPFEKNNFVQIYTGLFSRKLNIISRNPEVKPEMKEIMLASNAALFAGTSVRYKKLSIYLETTIPNTHLVNRHHTKVKAYAFFVNQFTNKWGVTGFFSYNKGLLTSTPGPMRYRDRNDLRMLTTGGHIYRIFNSKKFSYLAANSQSYIQIKSQGSFVLLTTVQYRKLYSTESIIPDSLSKYHFNGSMEASKNIQFFCVQFKPGYVYNFIFDKGRFFIAPALYMGMGADVHTFMTQSETHTGPNMNLGQRFKIVGGTNTKKYYATIEILVDKTTTLLYQSKMVNYYKEFSLNLAYRF
jgi:hypothetical protein